MEISSSAYVIQFVYVPCTLHYNAYSKQNSCSLEFCTWYNTSMTVWFFSIQHEAINLSRERSNSNRLLLFVYFFRHFSRVISMEITIQLCFLVHFYGWIFGTARRFGSILKAGIYFRILLCNRHCRYCTYTYYTILVSLFRTRWTLQE